MTLYIYIKSEFILKSFTGTSYVFHSKNWIFKLSCNVGIFNAYHDKKACLSAAF